MQVKRELAVEYGDWLTPDQSLSTYADALISVGYAPVWSATNSQHLARNGPDGTGIPTPMEETTDVAMDEKSPADRKHRHER